MARRVAPAITGPQLKRDPLGSSLGADVILDGMTPMRENEPLTRE